MKKQQADNQYFKYIFLFFFCLANHFQSQAQNIYNYENSLKFATYLYKTQQYNFAAKEYERLLFMRPENDTIKLQLMQIYRKANRFDFGIERSKTFYPELNLMPQAQALEFSKLLLQNEAINEAENFWQINSSLEKNDKIVFQATALALQSKWQNSLDLLNQLENQQIPVVQEYQSVLHEAVSIKLKKPFVAASLSTIVPGLGKIYSKDWKDGLVAFLFVGSTAWQAYRGFNEKGTDSPYGWIFAAVGTGFYIGNIFGSARSARQYNHRIKHQTQDKIENIFYSNF